LTADNSTLAIIGNVKESYALRAARQLFGPWRKADKLVPATFKQPETPNSEVLFIRLPRVPKAEVRFAIRGTSRGSQDFAASQIVAQIWRERWAKALPKDVIESVFIQNEAHLLPGILIFGATLNDEFAETHLSKIQTTLAKYVLQPITEEEFNRMKSGLPMVLGNGLKLSNTTEFASFFDSQNSWLDADTLNLKSAVQFDRAVADATFAQAQQIAAKWQKQPLAAIAVTQGEGNPPAK
jgi:predicted Zn-dependent peptidase